LLNATTATACAGVYAAKPYILAKEPCILAKEPCILAKEPYILEESRISCRKSPAS